MSATDLSQLPVRELFPGYLARFVHTERMTIAHVSIAANSPLPLHSHPHEQVLHLVEGEYLLTVSGVEHRLRAGMAFPIPSGAPHSGLSLTDCKVIDTFCPVREDFL